jgi:hypothetical protein
MKSKWSKLHITLKIGLILFIVGSGPLLTVLGLDALGLVDAGNAVGPGILAMLSFYPSIALIIIGSILTYRKKKKKDHYKTSANKVHISERFRCGIQLRILLSSFMS